MCVFRIVGGPAEEGEREWRRKGRSRSGGSSALRESFASNEIEQDEALGDDHEKGVN
jgi:hypothetical protein